MKKALILLFLSAVIAQNATAQLTRQQIDQVDSAFYNKEYTKALQLAAALYDKVVNGNDDTLAVEFLSTIGSIHYHTGDYDKALTHFTLASTRAKDKLEAGNYRYPLAQFNMASCLKELGRYTEAEPLFLASLPPLAPVFGQSSVQYTRCFYTLAMMYIDMDRFSEAESMCAAAVNFYKEVLGNTSDDYLGALGAMAVIYQGQSRYDKAEEIFLSLYNYYRSLPDPPGKTLQILENNLGELYRHTGDYAKAVTHLNTAVSMTAPGSDERASSLNNLALVLKATGDYAAAEQHYKESINTYIQLNKQQHPEYTNPVNNLGELYRTMGRLQDAVYAFEEVIALRKVLLGINHPNYANALNNLALVEFAIGYYDSAATHLRQCLSAYKTTLGEKDKFYANALNNLASVYKAQGNLSEAAATYQQCISIYKANYGETNDKYGTYLGGLGGTYRQMKRYDEAIALTLQSLTILRNKLGKDHYDCVETSLHLAETYREAGRYAEAATYYHEALEGYLHLIQRYFPWLSEKDKTLFYYNLSYAFELFNGFVAGQYRRFPKEDHTALVTRMYNNQLAIKSLLLRESTQLHQLVAESNNDSLKHQYSEWLQLRDNIVQHYRLSPDDMTGDKKTSLAALELRANEMEKQIARALNLSTPAGRTQPLRHWQQVRDALSPGDYAVEIIRTAYTSADYTGDSVLYTALILHKNATAPAAVFLRNGKDLETKQLAAYRLAIRSKRVDETSYPAFWQPLTEAMPRATRIWFSGDGLYQLINPYTLRNPATGAYVLDETELRLLTNTAGIFDTTVTGQNRKATIFSYPDFGSTPSAATGAQVRVPGFPDMAELPGTRIEADSIGAILRRQQYTIIDKRRGQATEEELKRLAPTQVLHIATHGFFLKNIAEGKKRVFGLQAEEVRQNPMLRSGLVMAGAAAIAMDTVVNQAKDDGILTAWEAAGLPLNGTELVVLSACETGLGEWENSQGVAGLQRSFLTAGARNVIMSLWTIDDYATQELMTAFYKTWLTTAGTDAKHKAFRLAQQKLREKYPEPYYWGAFLLITGK